MTAVTVSLSPGYIMANGSSTTTATATVTGGSILDTVTFSSSDPGDTVTNNSNGTATITSSKTPGPAIITATDTPFLGGQPISGHATLVQYGAPATVSVALSSPSIAANGASTTTATATVRDSIGDGVSGEPVVISTSDPGESLTPTVDNGDGTYTATITSSTTAGPVTVTATDGALSNQATLIQYGPAAIVSVALTPQSIPANGSSTTRAVATVTDAIADPVPGDHVVFFTSDPGDAVGPVTDLGNGTYTATITGSTTAGSPQVAAVDATTGAYGQATLTQTSVSSTTALTLVPTQPVTNQTVTMIATVTAGLGPSGTVAFENAGNPISGCDSVALTASGTGVATATCQTSFAAANSPISLTAQFTPSGAGNPTGSTSSPADSLSVGEDSTTTNMTVSSGKSTVGSTVSYLVAVEPNHAGPTQPTGSVQFTDGQHPLSGCASQPLLHGNSPSGTAAAVCRVTFKSPATHRVSAHYAGDASFTGSASPSIQTVVSKRPPPQRLSATLQWVFVYHPTYTTVPMLTASGVPPGASIQLACRGQGCPYAKRVVAVSNSKSCKTSATLRCTKLSVATVGVFAAFRRHRLAPGAQLTVQIRRSGFIAKYYRFTIRAGKAPRTLISCLAPGAGKPGVGC